MQGTRKLSALFFVMMNATMKEILLLKDLENVAENFVADDANRARVTAAEKIDVLLCSEEGFTEVVVCRGESILEAVAVALHLPKGGFTVSYGGINIPCGTFADQDIEPGAHLNISVVAMCSKDTVEAMAIDIVQLNPQAALNAENLMRRAAFDKDGALKKWNLSDSQLVTLPESFGNLRVGGDLNLSNSQLVTLPESFGNLRVGGDLSMSYTQLVTLPESFGNLQVGGYLALSYNQLVTLPESFGNLQVGGGLELHNNELVTLSESFGSLQVGGTLYLQENQIVTLPASFGNLQVGKSLLLQENRLVTLPESFGNLQVGGGLDLSNNQLVTLPESFGNIRMGGDLYICHNPVVSEHLSVPGLKIVAYSS